MTTKLYLDKRSINATNGNAPIKVALNSHGSSAYINTGIKIKPCEWDARNSKVIGHPLKQRLNLALLNKKADIDNAIETLRKQGALKGLSLSEIKNKVLVYLEPDNDEYNKENLFMSRLDRWIQTKENQGTKRTYILTAKKIRAFDRNADSLRFEDITKDWLTGFDMFMARTAPAANARNIMLRNIRTVFNDAIDNGITDWYPFRKFKIKAEPTKNRAMSAEELRKLFNYPCEDWQREYLDIAKLIFFLAGINMGDLASLESLTHGRCEYYRKKTNQRVSIFVEKEAQEIIDKYKGKSKLLCISDRYSNYSDYLHHFNDALKKIGTSHREGRKLVIEPIFKNISSYYLRYSWASIAAELDIPKETIAAALGHSTNDVTATYIRVNMDRKVDAANRRVLDYVLYGI